MTDWPAVIIQLATFGTAFVGLLAVGRKLDQNHDQVNSRMDELIKATRALALREGANNERARADAADKERK